MIVAGFVFVIAFYTLAIMAINSYQKGKAKQSNGNAIQAPLPFHQLLQDVSWSEVEQEMIHLGLDQKRNLAQIYLTYEELQELPPTSNLEKHFLLHLHINKATSFIDVYSKEEGDPYTEYMVDHEDWHNLLAYSITVESLNKYQSATIVSAILFAMTTNGCSIKEFSEKTQAYTG